MVTEDAKKQADEVPNADKDAIVAPVARFSDELGVQYRRTEGQDGQDDKTDVLAAVLDRHNFCSSGKRNELVQTSANSRENVAG